LRDLLRLWIAIEVTEKGLAIGGGALGKVVNEGLDLITTGVSKGCGAAVIGRVGFHEAGIELMLADQQAEAVTESWLTILVTIVPVGGSSVMVRPVSARPMR
jgi:hypothetical protein